MALLRKCLQQLRMKQCDQDGFHHAPHEPKLSWAPRPSARDEDAPLAVMLPARADAPQLPSSSWVRAT